MFASSGLVYFTLNWEDDPAFTLLPAGQELEVVEDLCEFIEVSLRHGISVLMFSTKGVGRCIAAAVLYLMYKYRWSFEKAYEFAQAKKPDVELNRGFVQQLFAVDRLLQSHRGDSSRRTEEEARLERMRLSEWDPGYLLGEQSRRSFNKLSDFDNDELVLVHSFINGRLSISSLPAPCPGAQPSRSSRVSFGQVLDDVSAPSHPQPRAPRPAVGALKGSRARKESSELAGKQRQAEARPAVARTASLGREFKERELDLYDVVGLTDGGPRNARTRGEVWAASAPGDRRARGPTLEEIAGEQSRSLSGERVRRDPGALTALQRSGAVKGVHPEVRPDLNLSELERELFPLENLTDYESYRKSLSGGLGGSLGRGSLQRAWEPTSTSAQRSASPSVRSRSTEPAANTEGSRVPKVYRYRASLSILW